jgi:hypothetical protein
MMSRNKRVFVNKDSPAKRMGAVWCKRYQRRTLTGIGRRKKTVRRSTGKTPRTIVQASASTSASIMVRFFCIVSMIYFESISLTVQRKYFFEMQGLFWR